MDRRTSERRRTIVQKNKLFNFASFLPIVVGICSAVFMAYVLYWPPKPAYQIWKPEIHKVVYRDGHIIIHRGFCINTIDAITITRDLVQLDNRGESTLRISLPQTTLPYDLGCHVIDRIFEIPKGTPSGTYKLINVATWQANAFREDMLKLPELIVTIQDDDKKLAQQ